MTWPLVALLAIAACHPHATAPPPLPAAGVSISIYDAVALVDDRRWVAVNGETIELEHIDPSAALASLTIESDLHVGACHRTPWASGVVRCAVTGAHGRHLVRALYTTSTLHYRAQHVITVTGTRATVRSQFAVDTPAWGGRADLVLYDGEPSGDRIPREVARGTVALDGTAAALDTAPREVPATLRTIYDGAVLGDEPPDDAAWGRESQPAVWVWLELERGALVPGRVRVHVEDRDVLLAPDAGRPDGTLVRLPLWADADLHGTRERVVDVAAGAALAERVVVGITNAGGESREVFAVEHLRPARHHRIERAWPAHVAVAVAPGAVVTTRLVVPPHGAVRTGYTIAYDY